MSRTVAPTTPTAFLWLKLGGRKGWPKAHAVYLGTGEVACGIGVIDPGGHPREELEAMADQDEAVPRCPACRAEVLARELARKEESRPP